MSRGNEILYQDRSLNMSDRYNVISTIDVVQKMERFGFETTSVESTNARTKNGFQTHLVRMKSEYKMAHGLRPEIAIFNSYDGTAALKIHIGIFRFVCANKMVVGENLMPTFNVKHSNSNWLDLLDEFIDGYEEKQLIQKEWVENMQDTTMSLDEAYYLAEASLKIRHSDSRITNDAVDPLELLVAKRREDRGNSAWVRYNILQESLLMGFYNKYGTDGSIKKAKIITDIGESLRINSNLSDIFQGAINGDDIQNIQA